MRPPSMDVTKAEAAIGPRGAIVANAENRPLLQKWLVAKGVASTIARRARFGTLEKAYNNTNDHYVNALIADKYNRAGNTDPANATAITADPADATAITADPIVPAVAPAPTPAANIAETALAAALRQIMGAAPLDETRVLELIAKHAPKGKDRVVKTVLEIVAPIAPATTVNNAHRDLPAVVRAINAGLHVALIGPAGCGKTTLAHQCADALGLKYYLTGAVDSQYALTGFIDAQGRYQRTAFRDAFERGGLFLFDEVDASAPAALLTINSALANGVMPFPDGIVAKHADFRCIVAANTYGNGVDRMYVGRNQLDAATLDRFKPVMTLDYDRDLEARLIPAEYIFLAEHIWRIRDAASAMNVRAVFGTRSILASVKYIQAGETIENAIETCVFGGVPAAIATKIKANVPAIVAPTVVVMPAAPIAMAAE